MAFIQVRQPVCFMTAKALVLAFYQKLFKPDD